MVMINVLSILAWMMIGGIIIALLFWLRPQSKLHDVKLDWSDERCRKIIYSVCLINIMTCVLPMALSTIWNGPTAAHERQYEYMAQAILNGNLYLDCYNVDPILLGMDDPYDANERAALEAVFEWDNAFYNGKYYMYFGVVPVFLLFLPFLIITGKNLSTFIATQIFTLFFIIGVYMLLYMLARRFFEKLSLGIYIMMSLAVSVMSVWHAIGVPVLYCTAITAGLCMEIWSLFFFIKAVWIENQQRKTILYAFLGSLFGALAFGCRPPIALANVIVLPMLIEYLRQRKIDLSLIKQLFFAATPYLVIGVLLMLYNYLRFDNPFEFGSAYQLTIVDMRNYGGIAGNFDVMKLAKGIFNYFFEVSPLNSTFPYFSLGGIYINYPILLLSVIAMFSRNIQKYIKEYKLSFFVAILFLTPIIITAIDVMWAPVVGERYKMDVYWLMGILCYIVIGFWNEHLREESRRRFSWVMSMFSVYTIISSALYLLAAYDNISLVTFYNFFAQRYL